MLRRWLDPEGTFKKHEIPQTWNNSYCILYLPSFSSYRSVFSIHLLGSLSFPKPTDPTKKHQNPNGRCNISGAAATDLTSDFETMYG